MASGETLKAASYVVAQHAIGSMRQVDLNEAKDTLPELVREAARGEEVVISTGDGASVRLVPITPEASGDRPRRGGQARGLITMHSDFDDPIPGFEPYT